jgi:hypothetical protein
MKEPRFRTALKLNVYVTKKDIKEGNPCKGYSCPISNAVNRILKKNGYHCIYVFSNVVGIHFYTHDKDLEAKRLFSVEVPPKCCVFIEDYDTTKINKCYPFRFVLEIDALQLAILEGTKK